MLSTLVAVPFFVYKNLKCDYLMLHPSRLFVLGVLISLRSSLLEGLQAELLLYGIATFSLAGCFFPNLLLWGSSSLPRNLLIVGS